MTQKEILSLAERGAWHKWMFATDKAQEALSNALDANGKERQEFFAESDRWYETAERCREQLDEIRKLIGQN